ncbi:MAG: FAD-dependent oxidoreductase, partial [Leptospiraceae bacterium]|nr:FAD-dependent oxidoreductase [Leptospiraceae bacterium]
MKKFDLIVIGYGSGDGVAVGAAEAGYSVAVVEEGPLGGTCLNRGCIPSKMLIHVAEVVEEIKQSKKFHVHSKITKIDFSKIVKEVNTLVNSDSKAIEEGVRSTKNMTLYKEKGVFVGFKTLLVGKDTITADKIVLAMGSRPFFPPIEGLREAGFITSDEALNLKKLPKSMAVLGGGYIGSELAFFFSQMGCKVTIIDRNEFLLKNEDEEVSKEFTRAFSKKINFLNNTSVKKVSKRKGKK